MASSADPRECVAAIDAGNECPLVTERSHTMGKLRPATELNQEAVRFALARVVHPEDLHAAVRRVVRPFVDRVSGERVALRPPPANPCHGKSIYEMIWEELDTAMERLMCGGAAEGDEQYALGLASALSIMWNPYRPDIEWIRKEAMRRFEENYGDDAEQA